MPAVSGRRTVLESLRAGTAIDRILLASGLRPSEVLAEICTLAGQAKVTLESAPRASLTRLAGHDGHQGVVAIVRRFAYRSLAEVCGRGETCRLLLADGLTDPGNLGSILRSAEAFGWDAVIIPRHRAAGVTPAVRKVAAGAAERVPIALVASPAQAIRWLTQAGFEVIGLDPGAPKLYRQIEYPKRLCLVVGAEGRGLSRLVRDRCDLLVRIPMRGALASLNAAVAAAVVMAETVGRREADLPGPADLQGPTMGAPAGVAQPGSASDL
ncbi:MAG: 23S rRNA (guanosine(2251)-2'-O)-methyltransferase RlmB [Actinomycetota bacterium]